MIAKLLRLSPRLARHPWLVDWYLARVLVPLAGLAVLVWLACWVRQYRAGRQAEHEGRWVAVSPPPVTRPEDAVRFWQGMAKLLAGRRHGWRPHVMFEFAWSGPRLSIAVWVPGLVSPDQVARVAQSAWPGSSATVRPAPVLRAGMTAAGAELVAVGGRDWLPLRTDHQADPLRELLAAGLYLEDGDLVMVQVAARRAGKARQARARAGARGKRIAASGAAGIAVHVLRALIIGVLDLITFFIQPGSSRAAQPAGREPADPFERAGQHAAIRKLTCKPLWEVSVRHVAATTRGGPGAQERAGSHAGAVSAALGSVSGEMDLVDRWSRNPVRMQAKRRMRHGVIADTRELAALAHLPYDPGTIPGLRRGGARPVPPPPELPRVPWAGRG